MNPRYLILLLLLCLVVARGDAREPETTALPVMGRVECSLPVRNADGDFAAEVSGLCLSGDGDFLWAVGDNGELFKIHFDGSFERLMHSGADWEGLARDPDSGNLFLAVEPKEAWVLAAPDFNAPAFLFDVEEAAGMKNAGLEGIAWYRGTLYLGAQTGATLWQYTPDGRQIRKKSLRTLAPTLSEIADLYYDPVKDYLWVLDSRGDSREVTGMLPYTLYLFDGAATRLLATYDLSAFANENPEAVCIDRANGCVWVAEDCGHSHPSILHKILFSDL